MKRLFQLFDKKDKVYGFLAVILIVASSVCDVFNPYLFSNILNSITLGIKSGSLAWSNEMSLYFGLMFLLTFLSISFTIVAIYFSTSVAINVSTRMRWKVYEKTLYLSAGDVDKITNSSIITRVTSDVVQVQLFLILFFSTLVKAVSLVLGGLSFSLYQLSSFDGTKQIWYVAFTYILFILLILVLGAIIKKGVPLFKKTRRAIDNNNIIMEENIAGNRLIRAFNLQKAQKRRYSVGNEELRITSIRSDNIMVIIMPTIVLVMNTASILIVLFSGLYGINNRSYESLNLIGIIQSFLSYFMQMLVGLSLLGIVSFNYTRSRVCTNRIFEIINKVNPIQSGKSNAKIKNGEIVFNNVCFKYNDDDSKNVLNNLNFQIKKGQSLGIIGQTGSGKSTLVNLLMRFYDASAGEILIDGVNIKDYKLPNLRRNISIALQEKILLKGTIKSNIKIGNLKASNKQLIKAAKNAQALSFINKTPKQFQTVVEQKGKNFSGGQKQRISIARALIKNAKIMIFDDTTSALDNITETKFLKALNLEYTDKVKILISQKIRTIQNCDHIIVLKNGTISEQGKHKDLLKNDGIYKSIFKSQESSLE